MAEIDRVDFEDSLYAFMRAGWDSLDPAPFVDGWVGEAIAEHLEAVADGAVKRLIINVPPRSQKTSLVSIAFPAWVWAQELESPTSGPGVRFMYASYGETLSLEHSVLCRRLIKSEFYQRHWGKRFSLMSDMDTKHKFTNNRGGERQITSIDARVTGRGGAVIVIDDPNATNEAESELKLQTVTNWYNQTMNSRLNDRKTGAIILIQQRTSELDLSGHILEKQVGDWQHLMIPMEFERDRRIYTSIGWTDPRTEEGELMWPERFDAHDVSQMKREMGPWVWSGQYQQRPEPKGGGIIKREWWKLWEEAAFPPFDFVIASLDTAYTTKTENDYSALTVWGVFSIETKAVSTRAIGRDGRPTWNDRSFVEGVPKVMLMNAWQERLELHDLVQRVAKTCKDLKVDKLLIENKAAGISVAQEIRRIYGYESFAVQLQDPGSQDKLSRLYSVQHLFADGTVHAPDKEWAEMVIQQVGAFPRSRHDDLVDTCSAAIRHLRDLGLLQRSVERMEEVQESLRYQGREPPPLYPA